MIIEESKDRYIRVLEYKYMRVCMQMEVPIFTKVNTFYRPYWRNWATVSISTWSNSVEVRTGRQKRAGKCPCIGGFC